MRVTCYIDYTCPYSYRARRWLRSVEAAAGGDLAVSWRTFSLKQANQDPDSASVFADPATASVSVLALAWAHAARAAGADGFHDAVFDALHRDRRRLRPDDLAALAGAAGVDTAGFDRDRPRWLHAAAVEHHEAVARYGVFGTPTLLFDPRSVVFVKLATAPAGGEALRLWQALGTLARGHPELVEIKRPAPAGRGQQA
jgi:predicted DsbA family dithiol-disulfide isomerase